MSKGKIKVRYKNGIIEPLEPIHLPEGCELEIDFKFVSTASELELSEEEERKIQQEFIEQTSGLFKGMWGNTAKEIDDYIQSERESLDREF